MELLLVVVLIACAFFGWKIAAATERMTPWEAAFGSFMLGPIGLALVAFKCRERN